MKTLFAALALTITATASMADISPVYLPTLSFPEPQPEVVVSTQGCLPQQVCPAE